MVVSGAIVRSNKNCLFVPILIWSIGCSEPSNPPAPPIAPPEPPPPQKVEIPAYTGNNLIDAASHEAFFLAKHTPIEGDRAVLCRRLFADLLGRYPSQAEVDSECRQKEIVDIIRNIQSRDDYVFHSLRFWRDRFDTDDLTADWRYLKSLYGFAEQLHRGELTYLKFVEQAASHPGFFMNELLPADRARAAYRAFFGREAGDAEAADLAGLYRPWIPQEEQDPDFSYTERIRAYIYPTLCQPLLHCSARLLGGGNIDLRGSGQAAVAYEDLKDWQREELAAPGRMIARQPYLWEAEADFMLNRFLAWSDGGRTPREPGIVIPELRQALAEILIDKQDYREAERILLSSWIYIQSTTANAQRAAESPEPPVFTSGPIKPALAEVWLHALEPIMGVTLSDCDPRYPSFQPYTAAIDEFQDGNMDLMQLETELKRVYELIEHRVPLKLDDDLQIMMPDRSFTFFARLLGGCPGRFSRRQAPLGTAFAFTQDYMAELLCNFAQNRSPSTVNEISDVLAHQMKLLYGRSAVPEEQMLFDQAHSNCFGLECTAEGASKSVCIALTTSAEMLFY
jgi:hypothetical protein